MNILFLTMSSGLDNIEAGGIYTDLMRKFRDEGHEVYIIHPNERRKGKPTAVKSVGRVHSLGVKTLNVTKTNVIEKGIGQLLLESKFKQALKKYFGGVKFDIILYSTPPITFNNVIRYAKKASGHQAMTYLLLKDIFPQNALDVGMLTKTGVKGLLYKMFRKKEQELYRISDYIGCMSPANVSYVIKHNPEVDASKVEICPNSYEVSASRENELTMISDAEARAKETEKEKVKVREKYGLPADRPIFIYGGNMGKPQGIPFLIACMDANRNREDCHFVIVGDGFDYPKLEAWYRETRPKAVSLFRHLPKDDYDHLANACDVGLIFLDHRFTIPNYPSRLLPYLMNKKPIIVCTDPNCDMGTLAVENGYGMNCESNDVGAFTRTINEILTKDLKAMGEKGYQFFLDNYTVQHSYDAIIKHFTD